MTTKITLYILLLVNAYNTSRANTPPQFLFKTPLQTTLLKQIKKTYLLSLPSCFGVPRAVIVVADTCSCFSVEPPVCRSRDADAVEGRCLRLNSDGAPTAAAVCWPLALPLAVLPVPLDTPNAVPVLPFRDG